MCVAQMMCIDLTVVGMLSFIQEQLISTVLLSLQSSVGLKSKYNASLMDFYTLTIEIIY